MMALTMISRSILAYLLVLFDLAGLIILIIRREICDGLVASRGEVNSLLFWFLRHGFLYRK
jgi:hypothetical protein